MSTPTEEPLPPMELNEEEERLLESHMKKNQATEPTKFQTLYFLVGFMAVLAISYLFHTIMDLDCTVPLNAGLYLVSIGITCYFLSEAYLTMYDTESSKGMTDDNGMWIKELEARRQRKAEGIKDTSVRAAGVPDRLRTAAEISGKTPEEWRVLDKASKQHYQDQEYAEEVEYLGAEIAELRHLQYQQAMGWSLLFCNGLFISTSVLCAHLLKSYDARINYVVSTLAMGLLTQLIAQQNDDTVKSKNAAKKKKN